MYLAIDLLVVFLWHIDISCDPWGGSGCVLMVVAVVQCSCHGNRLRVSGDDNVMTKGDCDKEGFKRQAYHLR